MPDSIKGQVTTPDGSVVPTSSGSPTPAPSAPFPTRHAIPDAKVQALTENVSQALRALPNYWTSITNIEGLGAFDLFSLNSVLGGTIEVQTVETLNRIREVWDPDDEWPEHGFVRSSQTFPDVRLVRRTPQGLETVLGIELKGWYLLSKEKQPSFRYTATPAACAPQDLIVVVPWHLSNVLSGVPRVYEPYIEQAVYAAEMRNHYWEHQRGVTGDGAKVTPPAGPVRPYMPPKTKTADTVTKDSGKNFGRLARSQGLMQDYCEAMGRTEIAGIAATHWIDFVKAYTDAADPAEVDRKVAAKLAKLFKDASDARATEVMEVLRELISVVEGSS